MRAYRYHVLGGKSLPRIEEVPVPEPDPGEVLVRVRCASLNPVDWKIAEGRFRLQVRGGLPRTMGSDFSGEVAATGPGVDGWTAGEPVIGFIDPFARSAGPFADYVSVPVGFVLRRPASVDALLRAALPCVGITAVALCDLAQVRRGSSVLVNGASGGVGHLAVQVAKARGALVTATASAARRELLASLGADVFTVPVSETETSSFMLTWSSFRTSENVSEADTCSVAWIRIGSILGVLTSDADTCSVAKTAKAARTTVLDSVI